MATLAEVERIVGRVALRQMPPGGVSRTIAKPIGDSEGNDALRVTLVLTPDAVDALTGDEALDMLVAIQSELLDAGEDRFAVVQYATEAEIADEGEDGEQAEEDA